MNKKTNTVLFTIISTLANIIMTLLLISVFCLIAFVVLYYGIKSRNPQVYQFVFILCFIAGLVLGMFLFIKLGGMVVTKFHLESKLEPFGGRKTTQRDEKQSVARKTNLPKSALPKEDTWGQEANSSETK